MKKIWCVFFAVIFIFSSCDNTFLSAPFLPPTDIKNDAGIVSGDIPVNVSATHGDKRGITLSWNTVDNAVFYYIYRAVSPFDAFVLCAETTANQFTFNVPPGSSVYYRVSSVMADGTESARSSYVMGTSLAQPVISDITDISEDSASVTWYMENVSAGTYKDELVYIVYCYSGADEVAQVMLNASDILENRAVFTRLNANTIYEYQVEAYLRSNQSASEKSEKMNAATARRFRPGPPVELKASRGIAVDKIELSFALPDMVDIALGDNMFDPKPLYFTISKRLYSESGNNEYQLVCAYFGINDDIAKARYNGKTFKNEYMPGEFVTWTDNSAVRGIKYEYLVQSYVDNASRIISSASSSANAAGWVLSGGEIFYNRPVYTISASGEFYEYAKLPFTLDFDHKGETYSYTVIAKVEPIEDGNENDPDNEFVITSQPLWFEEINDYKIEMDLTQKSSVSNPGRGIYSIEIDVNLPGEAQSIYTFKALGSVQISEDTQPIVVENFHIQDGYADRFVLKWDNYSNRKYIIQQSANRNDWTDIPYVNAPVSDDDKVTIIENYSHVISGQMPGISAYFRIRAVRSASDGDKPGQWVYGSASRTLGVPELSLGTGASYSVVALTWTEAQAADAYRIKYRYTEDGANAAFISAAEVKRADLSVDATGRSFRYSFSPQGYNDALRAGKEIQIEVDALNKALQQKVGGGEIFTSSTQDVKASLVGPALLDLTATKAFSPTEIDVSWNNVPGAGGYYVFRRQFNMNNTAEEGIESVVYYVPASNSSSINITGKSLETDASNSKVDTATVKAAASFANSRYTLRDMYLTDNEYDGAVYLRHSHVYRDQQNDMIQGLPYRYFVVPVIVRNNVPDPLAFIDFVYNKDGSNRNTDIVSYSVRENNTDIQYTGAAALEQEGFAIGFGQNVTATKGTYSSSGGGSDLRTNDGIRVSWNPPPRLSTVAGFTPRYTVFRRASGSSSWVPVTSVDNELSFVDTPQGSGASYEYVVGISNSGGGSVSQPQHSRRFIALCSSQLDERARPNKLGFMLSMVRMESVSRGELRDSQNNFAEEVRWYSAGVSNSYNGGDHNWGIDGYEVFVMNRNIDAGWHTIADMSNIPNQINLNLRVSNVQGGDTLRGGLLKVLRDYRHYFKVRSYVLNDGEKVYSPDPDWNYEILFAQTANRTNQDRANFLETDYVKWGARQISHVELVRAASIVLAWGIDQGSGTAGTTTGNWQSCIAGNTITTSNNGSSGSVLAWSSSGVGLWWYDFNNYKPDLDTNANRDNWTYSVTFLTVNSNSNMSGSADQRSRTLVAESNGAGSRPNGYGSVHGRRESAFNSRYDYGTGFFNIVGPSCLNGLYNAQMRFTSSQTTRKYNAGGVQNEDYRLFRSGSANPGDGFVEVRFPANAAATVQVRGGLENTALQFSGHNNRRNTDAWY